MFSKIDPVDEALKAVCAIEGLGEDPIKKNPMRYRAQGGFVREDAILTSCHAVEPLQEIMITNSNGITARRDPKRPIRYNNEADVAIVFLDSPIGNHIVKVRRRPVEVPKDSLADGWVLMSRSKYKANYGALDLTEKLKLESLKDKFR